MSNIWCKYYRWENRTKKETEGIGLVLEFGINEMDIKLTKEKRERVDDQ